jgi:hypothetical protein
MSGDEALREEGDVREDLRPALDPADEPLEQDRDSGYDQIEEDLTDARTADPRVAEPPP